MTYITWKEEVLEIPRLEAAVMVRPICQVKWSLNQLRGAPRQGAVGGNCGFLTLYLHTLLLIISPTLCLPVPHLLAKPLKFGQCPPRNFHSIQFHNMLRCTCDGCMLDWIGLDWQVKVIVNVSQGTIQMLTTGLCH